MVLYLKYHYLSMVLCNLC